MNDNVELDLNENVEEEDNKCLDINPISGGKRFVAYFVDLIITFFISFFLFNVAVFPLSKLALNLNEKSEQLNINYKQQREILYQHELLFYDTKDNSEPDDFYKYRDFEYDKIYTFNLFLKYWVFEDAASAKYDFVSNYFVGIRHDQQKYEEIYLTGEHNDFYTKDVNTGKLSLKTIYKGEFSAFYDSTVDPSQTAKDDLANFKNLVFAKGFGLMIKDIEKNDLTIDTGATYIESINEIGVLNDYFNNVYIYTSIITFVLATLITYLIIPLCNQRHKTIAMFGMKLERVNFETIRLPKWYSVVLSYVYHLLTNLVFILFIPMIVIPFDSIFGLITLLVLSLISFVFVIASTITIFINNYSRSFTDLMSGTILITSEALDDIYRQMGYRY